MILSIVNVAQLVATKTLFIGGRRSNLKFSTSPRLKLCKSTYEAT